MLYLRTAAIDHRDASAPLFPNNDAQQGRLPPTRDAIMIANELLLFASAMNIDLNASPAELRAQSATLRHRATSLHAEADALDEIAKAKEKLERAQSGQIEAVGTKLLRVIGEVAETVSLPTIILNVMRSHPTRSWSADELMEHLAAEGLFTSRSKTPRNSIAATLSRMKAQEQVERIEGGRYRPIPAPAAEVD